MKGRIKKEYIYNWTFMRKLRQQLNNEWHITRTSWPIITTTKSNLSALRLETSS